MNKKAPLLTPAQVAKLLGVSPITVRSWVVKGWLSANVTLGGHRRFHESDIEKLLQKHSNSIDRIKMPKRILMVDDDKQFRSFVLESLSGCAPEIEFAEAMDGFDAGLRISEFKPDVILLNYGMPGLSGATVCRQIRSSPHHAVTRIIALAGHTSSKTGIEEEMIQAGADTVLFKPASADKIIEAIGLTEMAAVDS